MKREYDFRSGRRGAVASVTLGKTRITIRLDETILQWFREQVHTQGGGNYQSLINTALSRHIENAQQPLEETLRRVIREEMNPRRRTAAKASSPRKRVVRAAPPARRATRA